MLFISSHAFLLTAFLIFKSSSAQEYSIKSTWDNQTIDHPSTPVKISFMKNDAMSFKVVVKAPFFDDPPGPPKTPTPAGEPLFGLWDYELVKLFLANENRQYIEIELGAWGHHFTVLINGYRQTIRYGMQINYAAARKDKMWEGSAIIPIAYLPPRVTKMNIYAFHGSGSKRIVEALYPVAFKQGATVDDHNLAAMQPFSSSIIRDNDPDSLSSVWTDALNRIRSFRIEHTWNGKSLEASETVDLSIRLDSSLSNLILSVDAPFYNDPVPDKPGGGSFPMLYTHEVVHIYLLGYPDLKYVEIELGPWGHYLVAFWDGYYKSVGSFNSPITYTSSRTGSRWNGTALIPLSYLPPKVYLINAFSGHGNGTLRQSNSLYPIPTEIASNMTTPNFHLLQYFKFIDLSQIYPDNDSPICSKIWQGMTTCSSSGSLITQSSALFLFISLMALFKMV